MKNYSSKGLPWMAAAVVLTALTGCGGGGGIASGYADPPTDPAFVPQGPVVANSNTLRSFQAGDVIVYDVKGTYTRDVVQSDGSDKTVATSTLSGTYTVSVTDVLSVPNVVGPCLKMTKKLECTAPGLGSPYVEVEEEYLQLGTDSNGNAAYLQVGRRDLDMLMATNSTFGKYMLTWQANASLGASGQFTTAAYPPATLDSTTSLAVLGQTAVPASSGSYQTWKTTLSERNILDLDVPARLTAGENLSQGFVMRRERSLGGTEWWSPNLSGPVKRNVTYRDTNAVFISASYNSQSSTWTITSQTHHVSMDLQMVLRSRNTD